MFFGQSIFFASLNSGTVGQRLGSEINVLGEAGTDKVYGKSSRVVALANFLPKDLGSAQ